MLPLEKAIVEKLWKDGPCSLDDVVTHLSSFSSGEIFLAVDRMSGDGRVSLRQLGYGIYQISLRSHVVSPVQCQVAEGKRANQRLEG